MDLEKPASFPHILFCRLENDSLDRYVKLYKSGGKKKTGNPMGFLLKNISAV